MVMMDACLLLIDHVLENVAHGGQLFTVLRHKLPQDGVSTLPRQLQLHAQSPAHIVRLSDQDFTPLGRLKGANLIADLVKKPYHDVIQLGEDTPDTRLPRARRRDHWLQTRVLVVLLDCHGTAFAGHMESRAGRKRAASRACGALGREREREARRTRKPAPPEARFDLME
jgi:hypothetical protein